MDIHEKSVDMDMDVIFYIHGNPGLSRQCNVFQWSTILARQLWRDINVAGRFASRLPKITSGSA